MTLDLNAAGASFGPFDITWNDRDSMHYALSVGAGAEDPLGSDLAFTTENTNDHPLQALPTMAAVLAGGTNVPSPLEALGPYDRKMSVHGSVEITLHRPLPPAAAATLSLVLDSIYDKRSGALVNVVSTLAVAGERLLELRNGIFIRGEGGWGGDGGPGWPAPSRPERDADVVVRQKTRPDQALLYRLNGDRNPLHSDPALARAAGFDRPILHGLCTFGFAGRAALQLLDDDPAAVARIGCRFASPVLPGDELVTHLWDTGADIIFTTFVEEREVLASGYVTRR